MKAIQGQYTREEFTPAEEEVLGLYEGMCFQPGAIAKARSLPKCYVKAICTVWECDARINTLPHIEDEVKREEKRVELMAHRAIWKARLDCERAILGEVQRLWQDPLP